MRSVSEIGQKKEGSRRIPVWLEHIVVLALAIFVVYGILLEADTLTSGYHFTDDHELIRMEQMFENGSVSLGQAVKEHVINDFRIRYRPLYWTERVTGAYLWGSQLSSWNYYTAVKGIAAFCLLYWMSRFLGYNRIISILTPCVVMLGNQFTPWFRSSNQESTGLLLASLVLCLTAAQARCRKYRAWYFNVPIAAGAILCGLVKESFTLFMPVFAGLKFWLEYWGGEGEPEKGRFLRCLKSNLLTYAAILLAMLVNVWMILFRVGVDKISYAGFHRETELWVYKQGILNSLFDYTKIYTQTGIVILLLAVVCYGALNRRNAKKYAGLAVMAGGAMAVQLAAHAKSGMWERYMIPYTVAYVFLFVFAAYPFFEKDRIQRIVFYGVFLWLAWNGVSTSRAMAAAYAREGRNASLLLEEVCAQTEAEEHILCAFQDGELNLACECWLETHGRTVAYSWTNGSFDNKVQLAGSVPEPYEMDNVRGLLCYEWQKDSMLELLETEEEQCGVYRFGSYMLIVRE